MPDPAELARGVLAGERRALARAITLVESTRDDHQLAAGEMLAVLLPHAGRSVRVGISGVPGVGKSTLIEALGLHLISLGHRVAVLAVDPSSTVSGGSILGDKTRMERLSVAPQAFIRPSPSRGSLGGVALHTREAIAVCEAAGHDVIIVETVGVGQSEIAVAGMTDVFVLLQLPHAGDELQAIKKGIVELADMVVFNKVDVDPRAAETAMGQMRSALGLLRTNHPRWKPPVFGISALQGEGVGRFWDEIGRYLQTVGDDLAVKRRQQALAWMWSSIEHGLQARFRAHAGVAAALPAVSAEVAAGRVAPTAAAGQLLRIWQGN